MGNCTGSTRIVMTGSALVRLDAPLTRLVTKSSEQAAGPAVFVRFERPDMDRFGALTLQVKELNVEIRWVQWVTVPGQRALL